MRLQKRVFAESLMTFSFSADHTACTSTEHLTQLIQLQRSGQRQNVCRLSLQEGVTEAMEYIEEE